MLGIGQAFRIAMVGTIVADLLTAMNMCVHASRNSRKVMHGNGYRHDAQREWLHCSSGKANIDFSYRILHPEQRNPAIIQQNVVGLHDDSIRALTERLT